MGLQGKMTADEAAAFLKVNGTTLRRMLQKGLIPYERHGWAYVLRADDVWAFKQNYSRFKRFPKAKTEASV